MSDDSGFEQLPKAPQSLADLMSDGFYMLLLLKRGQLPKEQEAFIDTVRAFLKRTASKAEQLDIAAEDIESAQYAFCAAVDEAILTQPSELRDEWERRPLQLREFGEHLAGRNFFEKLSELRDQGAQRLQAIEVYYYCLLLGFQGKYRVESKEKLGYFIARLGDEIAFLKGQRTEFAPHWTPPDHAEHVLRLRVPLWAPVVVLAIAAVGSYFFFDTLISRQVTKQLSPYYHVVKLPPNTAHVSITLP